MESVLIFRRQAFFPLSLFFLLKNLFKASQFNVVRLWSLIDWEDLTFFPPKQTNEQTNKQNNNKKSPVFVFSPVGYEEES